MKQSNTEQPRQAASQAARERWECVKRDAPIYWKAFREWSRIHGRRVAHQIHNVVAGNRAAGPVSFLVCSAALAVALTLTTLYAPSYAVTLDGEPVGVVTDEGMVQKAIQSVEDHPGGASKLFLSSAGRGQRRAAEVSGPCGWPGGGSGQG